MRRRSRRAAPGAVPAVASEVVVRFRPNPAGIAALKTSPVEVVHKDFYKRVLRVVALAKQLCPVDTGRLRSSIRFRFFRIGPDLAAAIGSDANYAKFVHDGIKGSADHPGFIYPQAKGALFWKGADHPVARVKLSDVQKKGRPFLRDALKAAAG